MNKTVKEALEKYPQAKELWVNPADIELTEGVTSVKVKTSPMVPFGQFMLSENELLDTFELSFTGTGALLDES